MSTVILLSSSPPRIFAQSPTPVEVSSPLPSTAALISGQSPGRYRFKTKDGHRDGFSPAFSTARQILAEKSGAKNALVTSPARNRFRSSQEDSIGLVLNEKTTHVRRGGRFSEETIRHKHDTRAQPENRTSAKSEIDRAIPTVNEGKRGTLKVITSPSPLTERAVARKLDWTPPKPQREEISNEYSAGFMNSVPNEFTYVPRGKDMPVPLESEMNPPAKRRKIDPVAKGCGGTASVSAPTLATTNPTKPKATTKRTRSPAKKGLTITGLVTTKRSSEAEANGTPLMQYLTSTQAQMNDDAAGSKLQTKIKRTTNAAKKSKRSGPGSSKSLLLSPESAMNTYDEQQAIFGSASQLARDDSPVLLRQTIEAMKQSEFSFHLDGTSSPPQTPGLSVGSTPQTGMSRFRKSRNLWAAAGRDEENALLHIDTVDLTDTPAVRAAFAGKDVLLLPEDRGTFSTRKPGALLRGGFSPTGKHAAVNIGNTTTPSLTLTRTLSSTTRNTSPGRSPTRVQLVDAKQASPTEVNQPIAPPKPPPPKPNFADLTTQELNKQIKSYGFKAMRKREKMIDLLERCWEEKHGPSEPSGDIESEAVPFGDFLSKVHDVAARPEPKVKRVRANKRKEQTDGETKEKPVRKPRQRKKKELPPDEAGKVADKPKVVRKRKSKAVAAKSDAVVDVDSIWDAMPPELIELETFDSWAKPDRKAKVKEKSMIPIQTPNEEVTPAVEVEVQPSIAGSVSAQSRSALVSVRREQKGSAASSDAQPIPTKQPTHLAPELTSATSSEPLHIHTQITAAILQQSKALQGGRNHNTDPTWHEKMLLYDPIVLEDLAAWLNTDGFGTVGEDREVSALEVREWCEDRGICCLWRGGWRGNKGNQGAA